MQGATAVFLTYNR